MAVATVPTAESISTEGLKRAEIISPSQTQISRAVDTWMQELFNDIWNRSIVTGDTRLKTLQTTSVSISVDNQRRYQLPPDFSEELSISILDATDTGTVQSGTSNTVTLESGEGISQETAEGKYYLSTSGTSKGQYREILIYNTSTLIATVDINWDTNKTPVSGDKYAIIDKHYDITEIGVNELDEILNPTNPSMKNSTSYHSGRGEAPKS